MSQLQGVRNLKDIYSARGNNDYPIQQSSKNSISVEPSQPQSAGNSSRVKLPAFSANTKNKFMANVMPRKVFIKFSDDPNHSERSSSSSKNPGGHSNHHQNAHPSSENSSKRNSNSPFSGYK